MMSYQISPQVLRKFFGEIDTDGNGTVDIEELKAKLMEMLNRSITQEQV